MSSFSRYLNEVYHNFIIEDVTSAAFGPDSQFTTDHGAPTSDSYAKGDARIAKVIGGVASRKGMIKRKKNKLKK